jgi:hypothetical protein
VQCSFKPIQDFVPRRLNDANLNVPFMTNSEEDYLSLEGYNRIIDPARLMRVETEPVTARDLDPIANIPNQISGIPNLGRDAFTDRNIAIESGN